MEQHSVGEFYRKADFEDLGFSFTTNNVYSHTYYETKKKAMENLDLASAGTVLDVGCGQGNLLRLICTVYKNLEAVGVDLNRKELRRAKHKAPQCEFIVAEASLLPFTDSSFGRVVCTAVLEHVVDENKTLREIWRVLKEGEIAVIDVPGMYHLQNKLSDFFIQRLGVFPFHREYSFEGMKNLIGRSDFELLSFNTARFIGSLLLPVIETVYTPCRRKIVWCRGLLAKLVCKIGDVMLSMCSNMKHVQQLGGSWFFKIRKPARL